MSRQPGDMRSRPPDRQNGAPGGTWPGPLVALGLDGPARRRRLSRSGVQRDVPAVKPDGQLQPVPERARARRSDKGPSEQQHRRDHLRRRQRRELRHPGPARWLRPPRVHHSQQVPHCRQEPLVHDAWREPPCEPATRHLPRRADTRLHLLDGPARPGPDGRDHVDRP